AAKIPREKFPHPPPRLTKPNRSDDIGDDNGRGDKRRHADVDRGSLIHARRPQFRDWALNRNLSAADYKGSTDPCRSTQSGRSFNRLDESETAPAERQAELRSAS